MSGLPDTTTHPDIAGATPFFSAGFTPETDFFVIAAGHLAVATTRPNSRWVAYHSIVESTDYQAEAKEVHRRGTKLHQADAEEFFPKFKHLQYEWQ